MEEDGNVCDNDSSMSIEQNHNGRSIRHGFGNPSQSWNIVRIKSLGLRTERFPTDSAIYWTETGAVADRLKNCKYNKLGEECDAYKKRKAWINYLETKIYATKNIFNQEKIDESTNTTLRKALEGDLIKDEDDL